MRLQTADHGEAGVQFRQEWLWGLRGGDGLRTVSERDSSGFKRIVEEQKVSRMTLWILAQGLTEGWLPS